MKLAWESLECARVIFERFKLVSNRYLTTDRQGEAGREQLCSALVFLGEHLMEMEQFDKAAEEFGLLLFFFSFFLSCTAEEFGLCFYFGLSGIHFTPTPATLFP